LLYICSLKEPTSKHQFENMKQPIDRTKTLNVLILDDNNEVLQITRQIMECILDGADRVWNMYSTVSPQEALDFICSENMDLVVTDWELPVIGGRTIVDTAKGKSKETRVIVYSGATDSKFDAIHESCPDAILAKPSTLDKIRLTVFDLLKLRPNQSVTAAQLITT
jgi:CheY-like chemotaxis protein